MQITNKETTNLQTSIYKQQIQVFTNNKYKQSKTKSLQTTKYKQWIKTSYTNTQRTIIGSIQVIKGVTQPPSEFWSLQISLERMRRKMKQKVKNLWLKLWIWMIGDPMRLQILVKFSDFLFQALLQNLTDYDVKLQCCDGSFKSNSVQKQ